MFIEISKLSLKRNKNGNLQARTKLPQIGRITVGLWTDTIPTNATGINLIEDENGVVHGPLEVNNVVIEGIRQCKFDGFTELSGKEMREAILEKAGGVGFTGSLGSW